jgi:hypothetical protein
MGLPSGTTQATPCPDAPVRLRGIRRGDQPLRHDVLRRSGGRVREHRPALRPSARLVLPSGSAARTTNGRRRSMARSVTRRSHPRRVRTRSRSAMPKPPRASSSAPVSTACVSRMSASQSSTVATSTMRSRPSADLKAPGRPLPPSPATRPRRALPRRTRRGLRIALLVDHSTTRPPALTTRSPKARVSHRPIGNRARVGMESINGPR